mgnify:CR=1 FL=1
MRNFIINVNGKTYEVGVEEVGAVNAEIDSNITADRIEVERVENQNKSMFSGVNSTFLSTFHMLIN